ncbi:chitin synthase (macronuclear) [Tetrahymena thermophila SB210]|uniref:chitin synthase n=1 Tax=Tetrahymena thermophila (strain SB210) TaxID=312017 RepID=Q22SC8_TETTS|nr:chitin synthase [Tetrahymena thermophila SB210]EAR87844.2 chitin synthase [Tetrahymena thermophila SB210]|eukprot:XP_001008089.2 chitin synthase [Tetrahymena thermophila SB210]
MQIPDPQNIIQNPNLNLLINPDLEGGQNEIRVMSVAPDFMIQRDVNNLLKPLNVLLTTSFVNGKPSKVKPITIFDRFEEPELQTRIENDKEIFYYKEFDEKNGYKPKIKLIDDYTNQPYVRRNLRNFENNDGLGYLYSKYKRIDLKHREQNLKIETIQMLICVTMYGEPKDFLVNTLRGIHANLQHFEKMGISSKQIVVVIFQDGIMKMKEEMVDYFSELDILQNRELALVRRRQIIKQQIDFLKREKKQSVLDHNDGLPNTIPKQIALLYQDFIKFKGQKGDLPTFSVFKHLNAKKLSSHLWFFEGFCRQFQPKYCALVDVGTIPDQLGLVNMFKALEADISIGGVCGFMGLKSPKENEQDESQRQQLNNKIDNLKNELKQDHPWIKEDEQKESDQKKANELLREQQTTHENKFIASNVQQVEQASKREKEVDCNLMIIFNVFFLIGLLISAIYNGCLYIINKLFQLIAYIFRFFLNLASLPQAQNYEYTTAHMIDKNFESCLGFLHVLPGAWSAYRYKALNLTKEHRENLIQKRYLKQILNKNLLSNTIQELNMFLAEDRILCLGIFCQVESSYKLKFIPDAKAFTDPVDTFEDFLNQRRRWINSSWFALEYVLQNYEYHIEESSHSFIMKNFIFPMNMLFAKIGKFNTYFIPAFYLFVAILCSFQFLKPTTTIAYKQINNLAQFQDNSNISCHQNDDDNLNICSNTFTGNTCYIQCNNYQVPNIFFAFLNFIPAIFVVLIIMILFASLTFKPKVVEITPKEEDEYNQLNKMKQDGQPFNTQQKKRNKELQNKYSQKFQNEVFKTLASLISLISCFIFIIVMATIILNLLDQTYLIHIGVQKLSSGFKIYMLTMIGLNYGSFAISLVIHFFFQPFIAWNIFISFMSYWIYSPIYNHILLIFSFCNIDDVTWGTKGLTDSKQNEKQKSEKIKFVGSWIFWNAFLLTVLLTANSISSNTPYVIMILGGFGTIYSFIKTFLGILHYLKYFLIDNIFICCKLRKNRSIYSSITDQINHFFDNARRQQIISSYHPVQQVEDYLENSRVNQLDLSDSLQNLDRNDTQYNINQVPSLNNIQSSSQQESDNLLFNQQKQKNATTLEPIIEQDDHHKEMEIPSHKKNMFIQSKEINIEMDQIGLNKLQSGSAGGQLQYQLSNEYLNSPQQNKDTDEKKNIQIPQQSIVKSSKK